MIIFFLSSKTTFKPIHLDQRHWFEMNSLHGYDHLVTIYFGLFLPKLTACLEGTKTGKGSKKNNKRHKIKLLKMTLFKMLVRLGNEMLFLKSFPIKIHLKTFNYRKFTI